jgi:hypothetical protein
MLKCGRDLQFGRMHQNAAIVMPIINGNLCTAGAQKTREDQRVDYSLFNAFKVSIT